MSRRGGGYKGGKPTWTTTSTSGVFGLDDVVELKGDGKWPRGPVAPTSLTATGGNAQVALAWTAPATAHGTITGYSVEYTPSGGSPTVVSTGSTSASYTVTGLTNGTSYTFRVAAVNHTAGEWSDGASVTPSGVPATLTVSGVPSAYASSFNGTYSLQGQTADGRYWYRMATNTDYGGFKNISYISGYTAWAISVGSSTPFGTPFFFGPDGVAPVLPPSSGYVASNQTGGYGNPTSISIA